ncbi:hypothetical protein NKJ26_21495, partial [Mesorhizobium sp. M0152]|uniref:GH25 family lysozyme n=1 Tax=Mesorhizobium sp. M0152 TaxID=2956898 RepID=UPI00333D057E
PPASRCAGGGVPPAGGPPATPRPPVRCDSVASPSPPPPPPPRAAGLAVGAYHFFTFCRPGLDQAKNFIAVVPHDQPLLPPVVDIEFGGNCPQRPTPEQLNAELQAFLGPVEAVFGKKAIVYLTDEAAIAYAGQIAARPLWLRSLLLQPDRSDWVYWQYHNRGRVDGIDGDVDLNVLQGGQEKLATLLAYTH